MHNETLKANIKIQLLIPIFLIPNNKNSSIAKLTIHESSSMGKIWHS